MAETKKYKKGIAISATLAVLIGASFSFYLWNERRTQSPHYVDLACAVCHIYVSEVCTQADCVQCHSLDEMWVWRQLKADELTLCTSCHEREGDVEVMNAEGHVVHVSLGNSHPFGLVPDESNSPRTLPLSLDGQITCQTCHDVHLTNTESHMLRLYTPQEQPDAQAADFTPLCLDCHQGY